jgi:hypothetical protein
MAWLTTTLNSVKVAKVFGFKLGVIVLDDEEVSYEGQKRQEEEPRIKYTRVIADLLSPDSVR